MELTNPEIGINHSVPNAVMGLSMNQCFPMNSRKVYVSEKLYNELLDEHFGLANIFEHLKGIWPNKTGTNGAKGGSLCSKSNSISRQSKRGGSRF